jgi:4-hydroxy-2-oxoheptanedioate aldolase
MQHGTARVDGRFQSASRVWRALVAGVALVSASAIVGGLSAQPRPVRLNRAIEKLAQGQSILGIINRDFSVTRARAVATADIDFVIIDQEHQPLDFTTLRSFLFGMINRAEIVRKGNVQADVTPIMRVPAYGRENVHFMVKQALDTGVLGVMFPAIDNREQALSAVRASRYPSNNKSGGQRGCCPDDATWLWGFTNDLDYARRADTWPADPNGEILLMMQIESAEGVKNINDIISVPGVGVIFLGPNDLSHSMGVQQGSPEHEAAIQTVLKACLARNVPCAITTNANSVARRLKEGFRVATVGGGVDLDAATVNALRAGRAVLKP